jgi:hypothetical protein
VNVQIDQAAANHLARAIYYLVAILGRNIFINECNLSSLDSYIQLLRLSLSHHSARFKNYSLVHIYPQKRRPNSRPYLTKINSCNVLITNNARN